jgi:beta-glucosidase
VTVNVTNIGKVGGAEVVQLVSLCFETDALYMLIKQYMSYPSSEAEQPPRHLRGYAKTYLEPGQKDVVDMKLVSEVVSIQRVRGVQSRSKMGPS